MYNAINRNSGLFKPEIADELNNAFSKTLSKIEKLKPKPLEAKKRIKYVEVIGEPGITITSNTSFSISETEIIINATLISSTNITDALFATLSISSPATIFGNIISIDGSSYIPFILQEKKLTCHGTILTNTEYLLSISFIR